MAAKVIIASAPPTSAFRHTAVLAAAIAVRASPGRLYNWHLYNPNTSLVYLHVYDLAAANVVVGTTVPVWSFALPSISSSTVGIDGGSDLGLPKCATAISIAATTTPTGSTAPGTGLVVNLGHG